MSLGVTNEKEGTCLRDFRFASTPTNVGALPPGPERVTTYVIPDMIRDPLKLMSNMNRQSKLFFAGLVLALLTMPQNLLAQSMSSTNYRVPFQAFGAGGTNSSSTNYIAEDTLSEVGANATGEDLTSTNYRACAGYQCLREEGFLTVVFSVQGTACSPGDSSASPFNIPLGTLTTGAVSTASDHICVTVTANAGGGVVVENKGANGALKSTSTPADTIDSATTTLVAGTAGFGICVTNAANGFSATSPYNGTCDTTTGHAVGGIATVNQTVLTATNPVNQAYGDILTKAAISSTIAAHDDYGETLTLTVTGTY